MRLCALAGTCVAASATTTVGAAATIVFSAGRDGRRGAQPRVGMGLECGAAWRAPRVWRVERARSAVVYCARLERVWSASIVPRAADCIGGMRSTAVDVAR